MPNTLITRFSALGDVALSVGPVYDVCRAYPDETFVLATRPLPSQLFMSAPENLRVEAVELNRYEGLGGLWRLKRDLERKYGRFRRYADLHDVLRTRVLRLLFRLGGTRVARIDKGRRERRHLTRRHHKVVVPLQHVSDRYREVFSRLGYPAERSFTTLFAAGGAPPAEWFAAVAPEKPAGERWLAIAPFAAHTGKMYPLHRMERVVAAMASRDDLKIFLFGGGKEETELLDRWSRKYPHCVSVASRRAGLRAELALLNRCDLALTMDSANMHLASLAGTRVLSIWGATHPFTGFMGDCQSLRDTIQLDMVCRPCSVFGNKRCRRGDLFCLTGISADRIVHDIDNILYPQSTDE